MKKLLICLLLAGCVAPAHVDDRGKDAALGKPPVTPGPLPPNVTRVENPDGTVTITIREPRCPNCEPWEY